MSGSSLTPMQPDDNLVNGQTYTFQFKCTNWFSGSFTDISSTILADITAQAPSFLTSVQVSTPFSTSLYNVQFTYEGDNTDIVSDVANSIIGACQSVSGDSLSFVGAVAAIPSAIIAANVDTYKAAAASAAQTATSAVNTVVSDVGSVAKNVTAQSGGVVNTALAGLLPILIVIVAIVLFVLPSLSKSVKNSGVV